MTIFSLVLGVLSLVCWVFPWVGIVVAVGAIICGYTNKNTKRWASITAITMGIIGCSLSIIVLLRDGEAQPPDSNALITTKEIPEGFRIHTDNNLGYTVYVPKKWDIDTTFEKGLTLFLNPVGDLEQEKIFKTNFSISQYPRNNSPFATYITEAKEKLKSELPDATITEDQSMNISAGEAHKIVYTTHFDNRALMGTQYIILSEKHVYFLTLTTLASKRGIYEPMFETFVQSLKTK